MRVIHTADWHLGQRFSNYDRTEEHQCFLDWLLNTIEERGVEALVIAGDIFDTANPGPAAQRQYYHFLAQLSRSETCRDVVIVGGNHDNPNFLNAPASILKALNIHIVGAVPSEFEEQCISLPTGRAPRLVVAAVPFLRDRDIRLSHLGETQTEQEDRIKQGIARHYARVAECIRHHRAQNVPVVATGHLFAQGCAASETSERSIHVGTLGQVAADAFTDAFDYIALGHLHRHQTVGGFEHIRYSGSPIPLSFSEVHYEHRVLQLDFAGAATPAITPLNVPCSRQLVRLRGGFEDVVDQLRAFSNAGFSLPAWAEVTIISDASPVTVNDQIDNLRAPLASKIAVVKFQHLRPSASTVPEEGTAAEPLEEDSLADPTQIFSRLLDSRGIAATGDARENLMATFAELLSLEDLLENQ